MATIRLTQQHDFIHIPYSHPQYEGQDNIFYLLGGSDSFRGGTGRETVYGGPGDDEILSGEGDDILRGARGADHLDGSAGTDLIYGGAGNDTIVDDDAGGTINAGAGSDSVAMRIGGDLVAEVRLGAGADTLTVEAGDVYYQEHHAWVDIRDFKAADHLAITAFDDAYGSYFLPAEVFDRLDVNDDGWLGAKDVEAADADKITVRVGPSFLELDVLDTSIILHGMTAASLDFLS